MRIISPPPDTFSKLHPPLEKGELKVFNFLNSYLPKEWEIYVQPHLNGLKPDFILINPAIGIAIIEVKDWNLNSMEYFNRDNKLWACKNGIEFCIESNNPISKLRYYKDQLFNLYCPRLGINFSETKKAWAVIATCAAFPYSTSKKALSIFKSFLNVNEKKYIGIYNSIVGMEEIETGKIGALLPEIERKKSYFMTQDLANDLRGWLVESESSREQREIPVLNDEQAKYAYCDSKYKTRRIKGCAGSGKTLILAARANHLAQQGKSILICTYNITLINYIHDIFMQFNPSKIARENVMICHFHGLCKYICEKTGHSEEYHGLFPSREDSDYIEEEINQSSINIDQIL